MRDGNTLKAGVFVVIALAILVTVSLWMAGFHSTGEKTDYEVWMVSAGGVRQGDGVRVAGMEVGRVREVELRPGEEWPIRFLIGLDARIPIAESATARLTTDGLLGTPFLEIDPGPIDAPPLPSGTPIMGVRSASVSEALSGLDDLSGQAGVALAEISVLVQSLSERAGPLLERFELLLSDENLESISESLASMRTTMQTAGPQLTGLLTRLDDLAVELETGVAGIPDLTGDLQALVADLRTALGPEGERLSSLLDSAQGSMSVMEMNRAEMEAMIRDLRLATANLRAFSESIKERPSMLVRKSREPDRKPGEGVDR